MPLYDFKCRACGSVFERLTPASTAEQPCKCGAQAQRQLAASKGYELKGGGYYETDFKHAARR